MKRSVIPALSVALVLSYADTRAFAQATYTAADCNRDSVDAVVNGPTHVAIDGDTIAIPPGTCTWTAGITVPTGIGISIVGAGSNGHYAIGSATTTILDGYVTSASWLIYFSPTYGSSLSRVSSLVLSPASGVGPNVLKAPLAFQGTCTAAECPSVRVDHVVFPATPSWDGRTQPSGTMIVTDNAFGVLDHNSAYESGATGYFEFLNFNHSAWQGVGNYGDNSWASADSFGTDQAVYVEDNYFEQTGGNLFPVTESEGGFGIESEGGGRVVCRFNTGVGLRSMCVNHGTESNGRPRGGRQMEFYDNAMSCPDSGYPACWNNGMLAGAGPRSGSLLAIGNSFTGAGINDFATLTDFRALQNISTPWGGCDGTGPWDHNDGTVSFSGTIANVMGSNPYTITVGGTPGWTTNQWSNHGAPYSLHDVTIDNGSEITGSGTNTLTVTAWTAIAYAVGDSIQILRATACIDQPSRIGGTLLAGASPTPAGSVDQALDPMYEAADTASGTPVFGAVSSNTQRIIADRDYYAEVSQSVQTSPTSPFDGTTGTGYGTLANRPTTCTPAVGYWATDQGSWNQSGTGGQGELFVCTATNSWSLYYTPFAYPHPLRGIGSDAGVTDGGTSGMDAGSDGGTPPSRDGSSSDATRSDGNGSEPIGPGHGCSCRVSTTGRREFGVAWAIALQTLIAARRRRVSQVRLHAKLR